MSGQRERRGRRGRRAAARKTAVLAALGCVCAAAVWWRVAVVEVPDPLADAPVLVAGAEDATGSGAEVTITWLGDTLLGDGAEPAIAEHGLGWPLARLPVHPPDEVVIANLEGPLTERSIPFDPARRWSYQSRSGAAAALAAVGVDAVSLANNHALDRGPLGLADTGTNLEAAGLAAFGAGADASRAGLPLIIDSPAGRVAVLGFSDEGGLTTATSTRPGVRRLELDNLDHDAALARRSGAEWVMAFVHWGENYTEVDQRQVAWAEAFAEAGYDLVVGAGAHVPQTITEVDGMPVVYSLGNWVFGTPGRFQTEQQGHGLVVSTTLSPGRIDLAVRCIVTDNQRVAYQPRPCGPATTATVLTTVDPTLAVDGFVGRRTFARSPRSGERALG